MEKIHEMLPDFLPDELRDEAVGYGFPTECYAWRSGTIINVIEAMSTRGYLILGVRVLKLMNGHLEYTGDILNLIDDDNYYTVPWDKYAQEAKEKAEGFIRHHSLQTENSFFYTIGFLTRREYKEDMQAWGEIRYRPGGNVLSKREVLPSFMPEDLVDSCILIGFPNSFTPSWKWKEALRAVEIIIGNDYAIIGGEMHQEVGVGELRFTNFWNIEKNECMDWKEYVLLSGEKTTNFINNYRNKNGEGFRYEILFVSHKELIALHLAK